MVICILWKEHTVIIKSTMVLSQAGSTGGGGSGPVGPAVETLTGNMGTATPVANNINVIWDAAGTTTLPSGFYFTGSTGNLVAAQYLYTAATTGLTSSDFVTIPMASNQVIIINIDAVVARSDYVYGGLAAGALSARSTAGTITLLEDELQIVGDSYFSNDVAIQLIISGNSVVVAAVSNIPAVTLNWSAYIRYHVI
jgi:hypothetical protein